MSELYEKIKLCKSGDKKAIEEIIINFEKNIIKELFRLKNENNHIYINKYDFEDIKSEIILSVLKAIKNMPIEDFKYKTDEAVKKYINITIINKVIDINKNFSKKTKNEYNYEFDFSFFQSKDSDELDTDIIIIDLIDKLSEKEKKIIKYKYIDGKSDVEIGRLFDYSRQYVNQTKNRALKKLNKFLKD